MSKANEYQRRKARRIAAYLTDCAHKTKQATSNYQVQQIVAHLSPEEWRSVSFAAGVAVADLPAKAAVLSILRERAPHMVTRH